MNTRVATSLSACLAACGCTALSSSDLEDAREETGQEINAAECQPPREFEAKYGDGTVLVKARELEDGSSVWVYYSQPGKRALTELRKKGHVVRVSTHHDNGKPHIQGDLARDSETQRDRAEGLWELFDDDGDVRAHAFISGGEIHPGSAEAWDHDGMTVDWSLPPDTFTFEEAKSIEPIRAPYPANARGENERKRTCTLVCLDERGEQLGIFRLADSASGFNESSEAAIRLSRFHPRRIGGNGVPSCMTVSIDYELMWATKVLRLPRPVQRRKQRGRY